MMDEIDRKIVAATQEGLPLVKRPYHAIAEGLDLTAAQVMTRLERMIANGIIRRIGVVPNHYALGLAANGMTVWDLDDGAARELGRKVGHLDYVSHCYLRPRHRPVWPYNLFAMVHGQTRDEVEEKAARIAELVGPACYARDILYSTRILKKTGLRIAA
ncbi:MAG: AsnC family transcriptional regulator [Hyphomicrobiaceae bacterium]|nr:AsnC family transcriptional regulator [Hyphomicrobiaceae bacterium]